MTTAQSLRIRLASFVALIAIFATSFAPFLMAPAAAWSAPRTVYFEETGHSLDRVFLDVWRSGNGASRFGLPITTEYESAEGHTIQYLENARFEWWPEGDGNGNQFVYGKIGEDLRPAVLPRTGVPADEDTLAQLRAWVPVAPDDPILDDPDIIYIPETGHTLSEAFIEYWWRTDDGNALGNPITEEYEVDGTSYQVFEYGMLQWTADELASLVPVGELLAAKYSLSTAPVAQGDLPIYSEALFIPPRVTFANYVEGGGEIWVDINLSSQYMVVYQGNRYLSDFYISSGTSQYATPTGTFYVLTMYRYDDMEGVLGGEYYNVPEVPWVLYFTNQGHAIHGAYWHNNFGAPMSHGCVNLPLWAAENLYNIAYYGMRIEIHY